MKFSTYEIPDDLLYTKEHEWARVTSDENKDDIVRVGITEYAAKTLNDVVYLSLPIIGQEIKRSISFGTVESIKAVSELYSPVSGTIIKINSELTTHPELVNQSPYENGWIIELKASNLAEDKTKLLDPKQYSDFLASSSVSQQQ